MTSALVAEIAAGIQVNRERSASRRSRAMNGAWAVSLVSRSGRRLEVQLVQDLFHTDLRAKYVDIIARHVHLPRLDGAVKRHREEAPVLCLAARRLLPAIEPRRISSGPFLSVVPRTIGVAHLERDGGDRDAVGGSSQKLLKTRGKPTKPLAWYKTGRGRRLVALTGDARWDLSQYAYCYR